MDLTLLELCWNWNFVQSGLVTLRKRQPLVQSKLRNTGVLAAVLSDWLWDYTLT